MGWDLVALDDRQPGDRGQRPWVPREVGEELSLAEEDGRVVGVGRVTELYAKEAAVCLISNVFGV